MALRLCSGQAPVRLPRFTVALAVFVTVAAGTALAGWRTPAVHASPVDTVTLAPGAAVHLATPPFLRVGKRYAFTWSGGGPPQTFTIKSMRDDGWILVEVADETIKPELYVPGEFPTRWLHVALAVSIQEMRPLP
jgi:hypothetical protein